MKPKYICKIHTDRLRKLSIKNLQKLQKIVAALPYNDWESGGHLVSQFTTLIEDEKRWRFNAKRTVTEIDREKFQQWARETGAEASKFEHRIWDLQVKNGCKISPQEEIARDAEREFRHEDAKKARAQRTLARRRRKQP